MSLTPTAAKMRAEWSVLGRVLVPGRTDVQKMGYRSLCRCASTRFQLQPSKSRNDRKQVAFSLGGGTLRGKRTGLHSPVLLGARPARRIRPSADGRQLERDIPPRSNTPRPPLRRPSLHPTLRSRDRRAHVRGLAEEVAPGVRQPPPLCLGRLLSAQ